MDRRRKARHRPSSTGEKTDRRNRAQTAARACCPRRGPAPRPGAASRRGASLGAALPAPPSQSLPVSAHRLPPRRRDRHGRRRLWRMWRHGLLALPPPPPAPGPPPPGSQPYAAAARPGSPWTGAGRPVAALRRRGRRPITTPWSGETKRGLRRERLSQHHHRDPSRSRRGVSRPPLCR